MADEKQGNYSFYTDPDGELMKPFELTARRKALIRIVIGLVNFLLLAPMFVVLAQISPLFWLCIPGMLVLFGVSLFSQRKRAVEGRTRGERLAAAVQALRADFHGAAIHVAGHPLLQRDQRLTLVLAGAELRLYDEYLEKQLTAIPLEDIRQVYTVVYDDARVPHIDVIDSAAQALQLEFYISGSLYIALFRSMLDPRPIDWYHALEQARYKRREL